MFDALETTPSAQLTPDFLEESLEAGRYDETWGKGTMPRKRAAIRTARKVFKRSGYFGSDKESPTFRLELEFFAARYLGSNDLAWPAGFKHAKAAAKWVKEYATVSDVASGFRDAAKPYGTRKTTGQTCSVT